MALQHGSLTIPGTHEDLILGPWERRDQETRVFGLTGTSVLRGARHARLIRTSIWIHSNYPSVSALLTFMTTLEEQAGEVDDLVESGNISRTFEHVRFEGFEHDRGPLPSSDLGWFMAGMLLFTQLRP